MKGLKKNMITTHKIKERFCRDINIPIKLFNEPFFSERINLFDQLYGSIDKWNVFLKEVSEFKTEQDCLKHYNNIKEQIIHGITSTKIYENFSKGDMHKYSVPALPLKKNSFYQPENSQKYFIGFDIQEANFSAMKFFDPNMFGNADNYKEFATQFTDSKHIINSKYVRQIIFGSCCPIRQALVQRYLMYFVYKEIVNIHSTEVVRHYSEDEIIIDNISDYEALSKNVLAVSENIGFKVRIEKYKLVKVDGADVYFKVFDDNSLQIKCANHLNLPFIIRAMNNQKITKNDKVFIHEGLLSKFIQTPKIKINKLEY